MPHDPIAGFRDPLTRVEMTPLIGVAMVLLLVTMALAPALVLCGPREPRARTSVELRRGAVFVDGARAMEPVPRGEIAAVLAGALLEIPESRRDTVYVDAHSQPGYAWVLDVLGAASANGVRRVGLITREPRS